MSDESCKPTWMVDEVGKSKSLHIIPVDDMKIHEPSNNCWCDPSLDATPDIWVHHAMDGRELFEVNGAS